MGCGMDMDGCKVARLIILIYSSLIIHDVQPTNAYDFDVED